MTQVDHSEEARDSHERNRTSATRGNPRVEYTVMTVARPKNYIHELLSRLDLDVPVRLIVGGPDTAYLERYRSDPSFKIVGIPAEEWLRFNACAMRHRAAWNYWRCLTLGAGSAAADGLLVFEDDVIPAAGWQRRFFDTVERIETKFGRRYVLALYRGRFTDGTLRKRLRTIVYGRPQAEPTPEYYSPYPAHEFYGTQAMYYPDEIRDGFAEYLKIHGVDTHRRQYDLLLREYLQMHAIPLFTTVPSLVEHIGEIGTGIGWKFHKARAFKKDLESVAGRNRFFVLLTHSKAFLHNFFTGGESWKNEKTRRSTKSS